MKLDTLIRGLLAMAVALVALLMIAALLWLMDTALSVWERLMAAPAWLMVGFWTGLVALAALVLWFSWRLLVPRRRARSQRIPSTDPAERLAAAERRGVDVTAARNELERLAQDRAAGEMTIGLLGEISTGKSTLVRALLPRAEALTDVRGGTTRAPQSYRWQAPSGDTLTLIDIPGTGSAADANALAEAQRCHILLYVCEGDLSRSEFDALRRFLELEKPTVVVLNKSDRFSVAELEAIAERLRERLREVCSDQRIPEVVAVIAGGEEPVVEVDATGAEVATVRPRTAHMQPLVTALGHLLNTSPALLDSLRDRAVFALAMERLDLAEAQYRKGEAERIVATATRRAIIGALAAVSPGTDILIQGYLGTRMVRELCSLYDIAPRDLDVERFLDLGQSRLGATLPIVLAVAGNGLKAFPGAGTVAGGLLHAVAYGLIFDALGRSLSDALADSQALIPEQAVAKFEEHLGRDLSSRAAEIARLAVTLNRRDPGDGR